MFAQINRTIEYVGVSVRKQCFASSALVLLLSLGIASSEPREPQWLMSTAYAIPKETTNQNSGYFSIVEGLNQTLYIGTAKYGVNAFLVEFDTQTHQMRTVVDAHKEIGTDVTGFAAQAKIHTRNNTGRSGRIYFGTKQGYPEKTESRDDYAGGYPMVYDPRTGKTRVYPIPVPRSGIISVTPDEERGVAYISTTTDARPVESTHFMILNLKTGDYQDLIDCRHMYAFIVVDYLGRAYHPILGGDIARYDPVKNRIERLRQTIDGAPPSVGSLLSHPQSHPINWDISPDRKTLYAVAMSGNHLYSYDLTAEGEVLKGRSHGPLIEGASKTDCRALCVGPDGIVWAGVNASFKGEGSFLHIVRFKPGQGSPSDVGRVAIRNPAYTEFTDNDDKPLKWHHGVYKHSNGKTLPRYVIMGICAARNGKVYVTTLYPFTVHEIETK